jgi:hypothetical protein
MCSFRISTLPPRIFAARAAILEKWRLKAVFWQYVLSDSFYDKNVYIQNETRENLLQFMS